MEQAKLFYEQVIGKRNYLSSIPLLQQRVRRWEIRAVITVLLPCIACIMWAAFLKDINVRAMNDLGLVSVLPVPTIISFVLINISFCLVLHQPRIHLPLILLHIFALIFMLFAITNFVEEAVRFSTVYRHAGYTEYIMRTGSVDPMLDAYFNWPGFFIFSAIITQLAGYHDILQYAGWAPVFLNLLYLPPLYMLVTTATTDRRLTWLSIWLFYITNWVGQDYYSPQGLNFFLYLTLLAILLKWFKSAPAIHMSRWPGLLHDTLRLLSFTKWLYELLVVPDMLRIPMPATKRKWLLLLFIAIFSFVVCSHPLTPFFVLAGVGALMFLRRCHPWWLPILIAVMIAVWILLMAQTFLAGHSAMLFGSIGQVNTTISANVINRISEGNPQHAFVTEMRVVMTLVLWGLALLGTIKRFKKGSHDSTYLVLATIPFSLIVAQTYGGEMFLRIYLFAQPFMVFFAASLFYTSHHFFIRGAPRLTTLATIVTCILLVVGFLITRYGNENMDYITSDEVSSMQYLYDIAPPHSLLLGAWRNTPWQFQDYEKYTYGYLNEIVPNSVATGNVNAIVHFLEQQHEPVFIIFTHSQRIAAESFAGLPVGILDRLEHNLATTGKFKLLVNTKYAQILVFSTAEGSQQP